jgi:hypothetical protein
MALLLFYKIYPNPTTGKIIIEGESIKSYKVFSSSGKLIIGDILLAGLSQIDFSVQASGVYYLRIVLDREVYTQKVVLQ